MQELLEDEVQLLIRALTWAVGTGATGAHAELWPRAKKGSHPTQPASSQGQMAPLS